MLLTQFIRESPFILECPTLNFPFEDFSRISFIGLTIMYFLSGGNFLPLRLGSGLAVW